MTLGRISICAGSELATRLLLQKIAENTAKQSRRKIGFWEEENEKSKLQIRQNFERSISASFSVVYADACAGR